MSGARNIVPHRARPSRSEYVDDSAAGPGGSSDSGTRIGQFSGKCPRVGSVGDEDGLMLSLHPHPRRVDPLRNTLEVYVPFHQSSAGMV